MLKKVNLWITHFHFFFVKFYFYLHSNIDYDKISEELRILLDNYKDENIKEALIYSKNKDKKKLISCLNKLGKEALEIIKHLSLTTLEKLIEQNLF